MELLKSTTKSYLKSPMPMPKKHIRSLPVNALQDPVSLNPVLTSNSNLCNMPR